MTTNTKATHTPGPWDDASKYQGIDSVRIFAKTHYIATVGNCDNPREVTEANARLIAAAPDLLAALKRQHCQVCDRDLVESPSAHPCSFCAKDRAALAKAEGR